MARPKKNIQDILEPVEIPVVTTSEENVKSDDDLLLETFCGNVKKVLKYRYLQVFSILTHEQRVNWVNKHFKE